MNSKVLLAFVGGLLLASGITYFAMRKPEPAPVAQPAPVAASAPAPQATPPAEPQPTAPTPEQKATAAKPAPTAQPVRVATAKPSPARSHTPPPSAPTPEPAPAQAAPAPTPAPQPAPVETARNNEPPAPREAPPMPKLPPPPPTPNTVTIPAGTTLRVRLGESLSTERSRPGDTFSATLDQPLVIDGFVLAERGARAQGRVVEADRSGRVKGVALLQIELTQLTTSDGQRVKVNTGYFEKKAESTKKADAAKVGIGAAIGAAIGAMAGGGKGAGIGAGVGGAAGAGDVLVTRGKPVELPVETLLSFRMAQPVTVTERLNQ